ncbi:peroxisomal biogenesis factor 11 [Calycina marina]|uniref:Peroxisomal biogenesis factor 11 n=1 Tax=Calycina marina TaxID=1763456 RepID=A0A9P7Z4U3_9HELO|nr:peroxisomal biogenesis factor 11 [Calycina marina]
MFIRKAIRFGTDAGGIEKILRLLQSVSQIIAFQSYNKRDVAFWMHLRKHFSLGRRYLRFFRFLDYFTKAIACLDAASGWEDIVLGVLKWTFLGLYMQLESLTILDAMGVWHAHWADAYMLHANKFWFYSLSLSILSGAIGLLRPNKKRTGTPTETARNRSVLVRRLVVDVFDLVIPGSVTGWIATGPLFVGLSSVMSTTLSMQDVWERL